MTSYDWTDSPLGSMLMASNGEKLTGLYFYGQKYEPRLDRAWTRRPELKIFHNARNQLNEFFDKRRNVFDLPLALTGTDFQIRVWEIISSIPFGRTMSYLDIARKLNKPEAVRAVGAAVGRNPVSIIVPCHRVVGSNGSLTGYAGGLDRKRALLELEGVLT